MLSKKSSVSRRNDSDRELSQLVKSRPSGRTLSTSGSRSHWAAKRIEGAGGGYVSISGGTYSGFTHGANRAYVASALTPPAPNVPVSAALKRAVAIPVMVGGSISTLDQAEAVLAAGDADIVCMVRALVAEPRIVAKGLSGEDARPCIGGNECHYGRPIICAVNPAAGREAEMEVTAAPVPRRVLVVGGGPAGIECALWAAARAQSIDNAPMVVFATVGVVLTVFMLRS